MVVFHLLYNICILINLLESRMSWNMTGVDQRPPPPEYATEFIKNVKLSDLVNIILTFI